MATIRLEPIQDCRFEIAEQQIGQWGQRRYSVLALVAGPERTAGSHAQGFPDRGPFDTPQTHGIECMPWLPSGSRRFRIADLRLQNSKRPTDRKALSVATNFKCKRPTDGDAANEPTHCSGGL